MNKELLNKMVEERLVVCQKHPNQDLYIYNYSPAVQYGKLWNDVTLQTRGLVMDGDGNVIARPFKKFFNMEEHSPNEIPNEPFEVFEKMDGSLGIFFHYNGEWYMATRGSFTSDQAIKGMEIARKYNLDKVCVPGFTYLFEIIFKENRVVVDYGDEERLVLLSIFNVDEELPYEDIQYDGWDIVNRYDGINDFNTLKDTISDNQEGYVIRFKSGFRMKIKGSEYVRLHRILTNVSNRNIWENLKDGGSMDDILDRVPDEFYDWVKETKNDLESKFNSIKNEYEWIYKSITNLGDISRAEYAQIVKRYTYPAILFRMLDGKKYDDIIWKIIKPNYEKPFKKNFDM